MSDVKEIRFVPNRKRRWSNRSQSLLLLILSALAGASLSFAFAPYQHWYLLIPGMLWLLWCLDRCATGQSVSNALVFTLGLWASGIYWLYYSIFHYGHADVFLAPIMVGLICLIMAFVFAFLVWLYKKFTANTGIFGYIKQPVVIKILLFGALWLTFDWIRELLAFPWLVIGVAIVDAPPFISNWLPVIGASGSSFAIAIACSSIYFSLLTLTAVVRRKARPNELLAPLSPLIILALISVVLLPLPPWTHQNDKSLQVGLVQPNIPLSDKWQGTSTYTNIQKLYRLSEPIHDQVELLIWPESAIAALFSRFQPVVSVITSALAPAQLLTGSLRRDREQNKTYNSIFLLNGNQQQIYDKQTLVPFGEYIPALNMLRFLINIIGLPELGLSAGTLKETRMKINDFALSVDICYEIAFARSIANQSVNSDALLTISDDGWFGPTIGPTQHHQIARVRARENGRYLIRVANDGITAIVNPMGHNEQRLQRSVADTLIAHVPGYSGRTPYSFIKGWLLIFLVSIPLLSCYIFYLLNRRKISSQ